MKPSFSNFEGNYSIQAMIFHENKVKLSLTLEKLPIREVMSNERGIFQKNQEKMQTSWNMSEADLSVPVLLVKLSSRES